MNMRILTIILLLSLVFACAPAETDMDLGPVEGAPEAAPEVTEEGPIKIGFIAPLTGDTAPLGADQRAGVEFAVQEINSAGGINGRQVEAIYEDSKCLGKDAATATNKLVGVDKVQFIVGGLCSSETLGAAPIAEEAGVVLISTASSNPSITDAGDFIFRVWPSDAGQGKAMAEYIINKDLRKVAVIYMNSDYNLGLANAFKENFEKLGGEISIWEAYEPEAKDFRTQIAKIRASRPDAIYIVSYAVDGGLMIKQIREMKITLPLFGGEVMGTPEAVEAAGIENIEGLVYAQPKFDAEKPKAKEVMPRIQEVRGSDFSFPAVAANAYDIVHLIKEALEASPTEAATGALVRDYLYTVDKWEGAGGTLTIDSNGDAIKDFTIMNIHEGQFYSIEEPPAEEVVGARGEI